MKNIKLFLILLLLGWCGIDTYAQTNVVITNQNVTIDSYTGSNVRVEGKSNLLLTSTTPLINSTVDLVGEDAWLYFEAIRPSVVLSDWAKFVKIDGRAFNKNKDRVSIYASGAVIIPNGLETAKRALTVYTGKNFTGESRSFEIHTYHDDLGKFDNKVRSFKLKKGFSATLANNSNGTGFSRYFIASDEDIEFAEMPEGLEFVSFVRLFKWEWTAKKGWAGSPSKQLNVSTFNTWGGGQAEPDPDMQFVPMRHNLGWDAWEVINAQEEVAELLGYNEPDRPDQSNMTVEEAIAQWPEFFKSGLRLGSPAPASTNGNNWLKNFMNICDELNYRVDFMVTHAYQNQNAGWWEWYIDLTSRGNRTLEEAGVHRPVWVTEWNNGANWTSESWPTAEGPRRDANMNIILDDEGNETIVKRPLSPENSARSVAKMQEVLPAFENIDLFEHHYLYNWVQDARSMELDGVLTPAGKYFAAFKSQVGFKKKNEYIHIWKIAPPWILSELSADYKKFNLQWYDHNGETGKRYVLQHKIDNGEWTLSKTFVAGVDYNLGDTVKFTQSIFPVEFDKIEFRVYAVSYKDTRSAYSRTATFTRDAKAVSPTGISGEAISSTILKLKWNSVANARSYRIERATSATGEYETIFNFFEGKELLDKGLEGNKDYFYRIYSINTAGESVASAPFQLKTKQLVIPSQITNLRAASGDRAVTLTWDFAYDATYKIYRSDSETGEYTEIASEIEVQEDDARYKDSGLEYQTYYYKVVPFNTMGTGPDSEIVAATPGMRQHLHLTFKENVGTTVYDEWGGYNAEFQAGPKWDIGREEKSAVFLSVADKSHLVLPEGVVSNVDDEFTIASWLYLPEGAGNNTRMFDFGNGTGTFMVFIPKYNAAGQARYKLTYFKEDGVQYAFQPTFAYNFPLGQWAHVAFTMQKHPQGGLFFLVYLNGELVSSGRDLENLVPSGMGVTKTNYLGRSQWPNDPYSAHGYDDFRIYTQALGRTDIKSLYEGKEPTGLTPSGIFIDVEDETLISVAPNPAYVGQPISITVSNVNEISENLIVRVINMVGNCVAQYRLNETTSIIAAPNIPGTYIINISSKNFNKSVKLIVK